MDISYHTIKTNLDTTRGYGNAGFQVVTSLQSLGHRVPFDDPKAPVLLSFTMPPYYSINKDQYTIGYTPWESTELPASWLKYMNQCDEVWATSEWVRGVYEDAGVKRPLRVYEHGLDPRWAPMERKVEDKIHFLHVGEPALRKGGQFAVDAFRAAFGDRDDVHLTVKCYFDNFLRTWGESEFERLGEQFKNVTIINENVRFSELLEIYRKAHCLVYPSYGEGFGFLPLQALGTGMPVISTGEWAPYRKWITLEIPGRWDRSIWSIHPGDVLYPDFDTTVDHLRLMADHIERSLESHFEVAPQIHAEFNWEKKTSEAFSHILERFDR